MNMSTKIFPWVLAIGALFTVLCVAFAVFKSVSQSAPTTNTTQKKLATGKALHGVTTKQSDDQEKQEVEKLLTSGRDGEPQVKYPAIEVLVAGQWIDQSARFVEYYKQVL